MMNDVIKFEDFEVRMVGTADRLEWVAADVCQVLGIKNSRSSLALLDDDEKGVHTMDTLGGSQEMMTITEPGLYALVGKSRKPIAKRFDRFVRHEILPCIRKYGCYPAPMVEVGNRAIVTLDPDRFTERLGETLSRAIDGMGKRFERVESEVSGVREDVADLSHRVSLIETRRTIPEKVRKLHLEVVRYFFKGQCPCCSKTLIVNSNGTRLAACQFDHWYKRSEVEPAKTWAICSDCNSLLRDQDTKTRLAPHFESYQARRREREIHIAGPFLF